MMTGQSEAPETATKHDTVLDRTLLGAPIVAFDPSLRKQVIIFVCGAALVGLGVCGALFFHNRGLGRLVGVGVVVLFLAYFIGRLRLYLCPDGVVVRRGRVQECCRWEEISEVACVTTDAFLKAGSRSCSLVKRDGSHISVTDLSLAQYDAFVDALRRLSALHGIPWKENIIKRSPRESAFLIYVGCLIAFSVVLLMVFAVMLK